MASNNGPIAPQVVRPPSERIQALFAKAEVDVDSRTTIRRYVNSSRQIFSMANTYCDEKSFEKAFILFYKYINLFVVKLPKHPEFNTLSVEDVEMSKKKSKYCMDVLDVLKTNKLMPRYQKEYDEYLRKKQEFDNALIEYKENQKRLLLKQKERQTDSYVDNLQKELDRKKKELASDRKPVVSSVSSILPPSSNDFEIDQIPEVPIGDIEDSSSEDDEESSEELPLASAPAHPSVPDRSTKPTISVSDRDELNKLILPFNVLTEKFMNLARTNTANNVETCAIIAGKLSHNSFTVTHLLVPKQTGTSDTCAATNEEDLFMEQDRLELITVGWIHTHPSQKAFLSSVDLHTHAPYQKMLPEAVAIVVAPKYDEIGLYSLSDSGLDFILRCRLTGFHPHPNESSIYGRAGHVVIDNSLDVTIVDFR